MNVSANDTCHLVSLSSESFCRARGRGGRRKKTQNNPFSLEQHYSLFVAPYVHDFSRCHAVGARQRHVWSTGIFLLIYFKKNYFYYFIVQ